LQEDQIDAVVVQIVRAVRSVRCVRTAACHPDFLARHDLQLRVVLETTPGI
jgi:hypothetical protein